MDIAAAAHKERGTGRQLSPNSAEASTLRTVAKYASESRCQRSRFKDYSSAVKKSPSLGRPRSVLPYLSPPGTRLTSPFDKSGSFLEDSAVFPKGVSDEDQRRYAHGQASRGP
jgi:hypothetical protein